MTEIRTLSNTDRTSWTRIVMAGRYYWPRLKWQIILFPVISALLFLFYAMVRDTMAGMLGTTLFGCTKYMVYFAPLALALHNDREIDTMLPVNGCEKATWLLVYFLIAVPLLVELPANILSLIFFGQSADSALLSAEGIAVSDSTFNSMRVSAIVTQVAMSLTCLLAVVKSSAHRLLKGILYPFLITVAAGIAGGIYGFIASFSRLRDYAANPDMASPTEIASQAIELMTPIYFWISVALGIYCVAALFLTWRAITRRQV